VWSPAPRNPGTVPTTTGTTPTKGPPRTSRRAFSNGQNGTVNDAPIRILSTGQHPPSSLHRSPGRRRTLTCSLTSTPAAGRVHPRR